MSEASECWWCGKPAELLCDRSIGRVLKESGHLDINRNFTCDAEMCGDCATPVGTTCGSDPDSIYLCPVHRDGGLVMMMVGWAPFAPSDEEVDEIRRGVAAAARRSREGADDARNAVPPLVPSRNGKRGTIRHWADSKGE